MLDVGPHGRIRIGEFALLSGAWIICDDEIVIGDHALISWNVVLMDTYRVPRGVAARRAALRRAATRRPGMLREVEPKPIRIGSNVWIGFGACVLPGVALGEGSIVGARSVVFEDVEPFTVVAGNPARRVRQLRPGGGAP
jgi:acetyltransferase-like isoleucine patch superfamily enzyme